MKKLCLMIGVLLLTGFATGCSESVQVDLADGTAVDVAQWNDQWLVINYWAEWCKPCREEIPHLNELQAEGEAHNLVVLGVNYDNLPVPKIGEVIERMDIQFPVLMADPRVQYGYERPAQLPVTVLINPARQVHDTLVGPQTVDSILAALN